MDERDTNAISRNAVSIGDTHTQKNHFAAVVIFINHVNLLRLRLAIQILKGEQEESSKKGNHKFIRM